VAEKKPLIVIKKITVVQGGAHGGAWKVAFADFMTAMMAFFLVMWLLATQSEPQKKAISDYFSTPSIIEYQFSNYGVELTLEKLFLDLVNEPLKVFQAFVTPIDRSPNIMAMGMKKIVMAHMAEQLGGIANKVDITADSVLFEIPDNQLFVRGSANPNAQFVKVMERVKGVTAGLEDSDVYITSMVYDESVSGEDHRLARNVAEQRLDLVQEKVKASLEKPSVDVSGRSAARLDDRIARERKGPSGGYIRLEIKQKKVKPDGSKPRPLSNGVFGSNFGKSESDKSVYDNFVQQVSRQNHSQNHAKNRTGTAKKERDVQPTVEPIDGGGGEIE
jgi:chemotaxis protein MotB